MLTIAIISLIELHKDEFEIVILDVNKYLWNLKDIYDLLNT